MKNIITITLLKLTLALGVVSASTTVNFSAFSTNTFGDSSNNPLAIGSLVQVGTFEGGVFDVLGSSTIGTGAGFAGGISFTTPPFDTTDLGIVGDQLAIRFFNSPSADFSDYGLVFFSASSSPEWALKETSTGPTSNQNQIDLGDLTTDATTLSSNADVVRGSFGPGTDAGFTLFQTAVPEPSSFALIAGCFGLALAVVRRRSRRA